MRIQQLIIHSNLSEIKPKFSQLVCKEKVETVQETLAIRRTWCSGLKGLVDCKLLYQTEGGCIFSHNTLPPNTASRLAHICNIHSCTGSRIAVYTWLQFL